MMTLILAIVILLGAGLVACAVLDHADVMRTLAWQQMMLTATRINVDEGTWRGITEQVAADALGESVEIIAFSGMSVGRGSWLRFVLRNGRALVFATTPQVPECRGRGHRLYLKQHAQAIGELQALWAYFGREAGHAGAIPRHRTWYVLPLQAPQYKLLHPARVQLAASLQLPIYRRIFRHGRTRTYTEL